MSRINTVFTALKEQGRQALIPYVTAGDPLKESTVPMMHAMVEAGADIIELGVPFSDPMADGPTIQLACERALEHGTSLRDVLAMVTEFRSKDSATPIVLMGYLNPVEAMGYQAFVDAAIKAGVDGVLMVDLPPEEAHDVDSIFKKAGLDVVYLIAPTTTDKRIESIGHAGSGYVYYVSIKGVEAGGLGLDGNDHAAPLSKGRPGVLHGNRTYLMEDENGQIMGTHSISAGLDYPGVGPEHSWLKDVKRAQYVAATDDEAMDAFHKLTRLEGIMPALESAHAVAYAMKLAATMSKDKVIVVNLSGRGDKDIHTVATLDGVTA